MSKVLVYADSNLNIIDGSSIWVESIVETLSPLFGEVHVLLKSPEQNVRITGALRRIPGVVLHQNHTNQIGGNSATDSDNLLLSQEQAVCRIKDLELNNDYDAIVVRGREVNSRMVRHEVFRGKLWSYITDVPFPLSSLNASLVTELRSIASFAKRIFMQTESARSYFEGVVAEAAGKTCLMTPVVPDRFFDESLRANEFRQGVLRVVYAGKMAKDWRTLEMLSLPAKLRERGVECSLIVLGDKFQYDRCDPRWHVQMKNALESACEDESSGVTWLGGLPRDEVLQYLKSADLGLCWRSAQLESSLEISSKMLEYCAAGLVPLINRSADHESLFGKSFAGFLEGDTIADVVDAICRLDEESISKSSQKAREVSRTFSASEARERLRAEFVRSGVLRDARSSGDSRVLLVVSHDFKFLGEMLDALTVLPGVEVQIDRWSSLHQNNEVESEEKLKVAQTVFCEWAGPNLVWYSRRKREGQTLVCRLHGFELRGAWLDDVIIGAVDKWVVVSEHFKQALLERLPVKGQSVEVMPNFVDVEDLNRPKVDGAQFRLGLAGIVSFNKRPDRALELLSSLLDVDDRYFLHIKGRMPWEYAYEWKDKPFQRLCYDELFRNAGKEDLRRHVIFEDFSPDMSSWLRRIGVILSPSHKESFHMAPAEGMASGAVPVFWPRDGVRDIFSSRWEQHSVERARDFILSLREDQSFQIEARQASAFARRWGTETLMPIWSRVLGL